MLGTQLTGLAPVTLAPPVGQLPAAAAPVDPMWTLPVADQRAGGTIEVELPSGVKLRLTGAVDEAALHRVDRQRVVVTVALKKFSTLTSMRPLRKYNRGVISMKRRARWAISAFTMLVSLFLAPIGAFASDHADPTNLTDPNANITDLFFFPKGDQYILIFNVRRALTASQPYDLAPYEYRVNFDLTTPTTFDSAEDRARYGGTITTPDRLHPDATITVRLNNNTTLKSITVNGLKNTEKIRTYTGVRDDPFIFPRFFKVNVIAMVMSLPKDAFPVGQHDFMLWGTASKDGAELDHVGRSIRTQLPRFGIINTTPPGDQLKTLMENKESRDKLYNFFKGNREWYSKVVADLIQPTFQIRKYDLVPDVMIYTDRFPAGYPNGRLLTDDVVAQTCAFGDCLLQEISYIEGGWPRATTNDRPFLDDWPYLAEPWPERPESAAPTRSILPYIIGIVLALALVSWAVIELLRRLIIWLWLKARAKPQAA